MFIDNNKEPVRIFREFDPKNTVLRRMSAFFILAILIIQSIVSVAPVRAHEINQAATLGISPDIVISQVYGGGGNAGGQFNNDFIELFNRGTAPVDITGWSVQYASSTGTSWQVTTLTGTIAPGKYYLVQEAAGANMPAPLPAPDATGTIPMSATNGKVALSNASTALTGGCPTGANIIDFVGFGSANCFEGTAATPVLSNSTAAIRNGAGCTDTDQNSSDFTVAAPLPRNSSSPQNSCGSGTTNPSGTGAANPSAVDPGASTLLTVTVTPGTNPASTGLTVTGDLSTIGGSASQMFFDDGTGGDATAGDNVFSYNATVAPATTSGQKMLPVTITDAQSRTGSATINLTVNSQTPTNPSGVGAANPASVPAGGTTLLTVTVTPGTNPASTGLTVTGDLSAIGGSATQTFFDNGTNGDTTAGDNVFSFSATVSAGTSPGVKSLPTTISDAQSRTGSATISLTVSASTAGQPLPFAQNWTNTALITVNNDWSAVPGIVGYRGDNLTSDVGADPQTILADGSATPVNVNANLTNPDTFTSGGIGEFELTDPVVAFQGSGTADAPHIIISIDTTAQNNITVFYNLRDIDGSSDNAAQSVALQYRVGDSGNYTNVPAAFVSDATDGPNTATLVTPVAVALPAAVSNQPLVQLRLITTNAVGNDELVGIDDIQIVSNGTIPLSGTGTASPNDINAGAITLLKVAVNPGSNPASTGIAVTGDLSSIGGSASQMFFDDGTNGDATAGDNIFSYLATVAPATTGGQKTLPVTITDAQSRSANASINLTVRVPASPEEHLVMGNPTNATTDPNNPFNYLLPKPQYVMSYHRDRGIPNWVSWHLDASWLGSAPRQDDFRPDPSLPAGWYQVQSTDYSGSGFDRGHHTPSADRTSSIPDNSATFFMTNMMPQAPDNNQGPWEELESYGRTLVNQGKELYILAAGTGTGGTGSNGPATTVAGGNVTVPAQTWKVILVLPAGDNDVSRVTTQTETIAVIMPNTQGIRNDPWQNYRVSVDQVEALTGYDFFSNVPPAIQAVIEARNGPAAPRKARADFDGDFRTDLSVFRPAEGNWYVNGSTGGLNVINFGVSGDVPVPGDYDGDGKTDWAVFRPSETVNTPDFYILNSSNLSVSSYEWGSTGDIPVPGDYDGDGKTDIAVFRPSTGIWYAVLSTTGAPLYIQFGLSGDKPVVGDYDGDGMDDQAVYRDGVWYLNRSSTGFAVVNFGLATDSPVQADYDGDGKTDTAVFRPSAGTWYALLSGTGSTAIIPFGTSGDVPVPGDYDGDGKDDQAIYRNGQWWIRASTSGVSTSSFGLGSDLPVPNEYLP